MAVTINPQLIINTIEERFKMVLPHTILDLQYDYDADVLGIRFREYSDSISDAIDDEGMVISIHDPKTDEIVGLEILDYREVYTSVAKSIQDGATKGEYIISIYYKNKLKSGELAHIIDDKASLPDITINDILPEGFTLVSSEPNVTNQRMRLIEGKSITVLEWTIKNIRPDQVVEIKYTIKGEPGAAYEVEEAQALLTA
jgi:hypothetical protein